jgi:hypothetical protein
MEENEINKSLFFHEDLGIDKKGYEPSSVRGSQNNAFLKNNVCLNEMYVLTSN